MIGQLRRHWKAVAVFLAVFLLSQLYRAPAGSGPLVALAYKARDFIASLLLGLAVDLWTLRRQIMLLMKNRERTASSVRIATSGYVEGQLLGLGENTAQLTSERGLEVSSQELAALIKGAYAAHGDGQCVVIEKMLPSEYGRAFPTFDSEHFAKGRTREPGRDIWVLGASRDAIEGDFRQHRTAFRLFYDATRDHNSVLLVVTPTAVAEASAGLPAPNMWLFVPHYAVFARELPGDGPTRHYTVFLRSLDHDLSLILRARLRQVAVESRELSLGGSGVVYDERTPEDATVHQKNIVWGLKHGG